MTTPLLSIVILSHNRREALLRTLGQMVCHDRGRNDAGISREVIVVDNASKDGSPEAVRENFPDVQLVALHSNEAIQGFNIGAARARGVFLLILDDDAWVEPDVLCDALEYLKEHNEVGGVALLPKHPATGICEWPFATRASDEFPVMGCGNLVRGSAWRQVQGYEQAFFLYRNDVDLALKLLSAGWGIAFRPEWVVWHDSPAAARKSERWLHLATRNWVWLVRRHEQNPLVMLVAFALHLATALRAAGLDVDRMNCVMNGFIDGWREPVPKRPAVCTSSGALRKLLRLRLGL
ncbi:MAG: glycosyltransferase family 2 protein [Phycisphaerales bacterium]